MTRRNHEQRWLVALYALLSVAACKEVPQGQSKPAAEGAGAAAPFHVATLERLREQGLRIGNFEATAAEPYGAKQCARGKVSDLEVLLCAYADDKAASAAEAKLLGFAKGALTGALRVREAVALVVADRAKNDVKGERINRLVSGFVGPKKPSPPPAKAAAGPAS